MTNNLYEEVPADKELPDEDNIYTTTIKNDLGEIFTRDSEFIFGCFVVQDEGENVVSWYRPVTRESIEAFLREFGEKVWDSAANREWGEIYNENNPEDKIEITAPDKQTAITELINKTL